MTIRIPHFVVYIVAAFSQFFALFKKSAPTLNIEKAGEITQANWFCSSKKAMRDFDYKQNYSLEKGVQETVDWYKNEKWL